MLGEKRNEEIRSRRRCEDRGRTFGLYKGIKSTSLEVQGREDTEALEGISVCLGT